MNHDDATAIHGREPREREKMAMGSGWKGHFSPVNHSNTIQSRVSVSSCMRKSEASAFLRGMSSSLKTVFLAGFICLVGSMCSPSVGSCSMIKAELTGG